jgi:methyltransferase (TIGR00027 family)
MTTTHLNEGRISDVSATLFITLYCRAVESQSAKPLIYDRQAVRITQQLSPLLIESRDPRLTGLAQGKLDRRLVTMLALRAGRFDDYARDFLKRNPNGVIVNLGCGLDTRYQRLADPQAVVYDLDFPEVINLKRQLLNETENYHFIPASVLDFAWMEALADVKDRPFLFLAEGLFMYLAEADVRALVLKLQETFPGAELVCEVFNAFWLQEPWGSLVNRKLRQRLNIGQGAAFQFGVRNSRALAAWQPGIEYLDDWSFLDEVTEKLGWFRLFGRFKLIRQTQWVLHYRLNEFPGR